MPADVPGLNTEFNNRLPFSPNTSEKKTKQFISDRFNHLDSQTVCGVIVV